MTLVRSHEVLEANLDRKIQIASTLMQRIDAGEQLGRVLPQLKTLVSLEADETMRFFLDVLIYGLDGIPGFNPPAKTQEQRNAFELWMDLCKVEDVHAMSVDSAIRDAWTEREPRRSKIIRLSVYQMEQRSQASPVASPTSEQEANLLFQAHLFNAEAKRVLNDLRSFLYDYASKVWQENLRQREYIQLLGPDYRLVLDSLGALDSEVKDELLAALDTLRSENPANWALSALGCRTVVLKLGTILWKVPGNQYSSEFLGKSLDVGGDREKNKLSAYVDAYWQIEADEQSKKLLEEALTLIPAIYDKGSKGKSAGTVRRAEAQQLVVDTFKLVDSLQKTTRLVPLSSLPLKRIMG